MLVQGGGERQCLALSRALSREGHEVSIYTSAYNREACYPEICAKLNVHVVGRGPLSFLSRPRFLRRFLDMHTLAKTIQEPHEIWNPHHWPAHWASVWLKQKLGGRVIWMCNDVPDMRRQQQELRNSRSYWKRLGQYVYGWLHDYDAAQIRTIDQVVVLSEWAKSELLKVYSAPVEVIRSGMDSEQLLQGNRQKFRDKLGVASDCFLVLWFGILMPHRRLEDAIAAVGLLRNRGQNVRLLLAGSDRSFPRYLKRLKELARLAGIEDLVIFTGPLDEGEVRDAFAGCDVFLFPNEEQTWGLTVMEAMAAGCPVIVSKGSGVHEVLQDRVTALLVSPRDPAGIASKLELLLHDSELRRELAQRGQSYVLGRFSWGNYARDMLAVFEETLSAKKSVNHEARVS